MRDASSITNNSAKATIPPMQVLLLPSIDEKIATDDKSATEISTEEETSSSTKDHNDAESQTNTDIEAQTKPHTCDTRKEKKKVRCHDHRKRRKSRLIWNGTGFIAPETDSASSHRNKFYNRLSSNPRDELRRFRCSLFWLGLDQSTPVRMIVSWIVALTLSIFVPLFFLLTVSTEDQQPIHRLVQISEGFLAFISFTCLSHNLRKHGLRRFLFLEQINQETLEVRNGYIAELNKAFLLLQLILLPSFLMELIHQVWWFTNATVSFPFPLNPSVKRAIMCIAVVLSWLYKTSAFLLPCVLFRLMCYLQNLRFDGYIKMLETVTDVPILLKQYMRLRQQLNIISHRYRLFIVLSLVTVTATQFIFLLVINIASGPMGFFRAGSVGVCALVQLIGFMICLHGAARITHRAQRIISIVSQWHAMSICQIYGPVNSTSEPVNHNLNQWTQLDKKTCSECEDNWNPDLICTRTGCDVFYMQQAFVAYIQHDQAGISLFGYTLDRSFVYALASVQLSLLLFFLGLTIGID